MNVHWLVPRAYDVVRDPFSCPLLRPKFAFMDYIGPGDDQPVHV